MRRRGRSRQRGSLWGGVWGGCVGSRLARDGRLKAWVSWGARVWQNGCVRAGAGYRPGRLLEEGSGARGGGEKLAAWMAGWALARVGGEGASKGEGCAGQLTGRSRRAVAGLM